MREADAELPVVSWSLYQLVWVTGWWDWEMSGVAERDGKRVFFELIEQRPDGERLFAIYDPPAEVWARIDEEHKDFQTYVGAHWDFEQGAHKKGGQRPATEHHKFYDKWPKDSIKMRPEWQIAIADSGIETEEHSARSYQPR